MHKPKLTFLAVLGAVAIAAAGCGSSSSSTTPKTSATAAATAPLAATAKSSGANAGHTAGGATVTSGPVHATLTGANHTPTVGKLWPYSVHLTDASGKGLNGTVDIQFAFHGQIVGHDTPRTHPIKNGLWHDNLTFPAAAVGQPLVFQAVVHTGTRSITLNWPVTVKK